MTARGKKAIPTRTEICYTRKQSRIKSSYIFEVLGWNLLNPTLSAILKTTKIHESPQRLELSGLFLFLRFRDVHEDKIENDPVNKTSICSNGQEEPKSSTILTDPIDSYGFSTNTTIIIPVNGLSNNL